MQLKVLSEPEFAEWLRPFLSIDSNSDEKLLGIRVPKLRKLAKELKNIDFITLEKLLRSNIHEARALAIFIMLIKTKKEPQVMCDMYLNNLDTINNWDLIDYTAPYIVSPNVSVDTLRELAKSDYLWANRVSMVSTMYYVKKNDFDLALEFAEKFIFHPHHLMHKAAGWILREIGKRDEKVLIDFLDKFSSKMPSVMRSYATEKLKKTQR